MRSPSEESATVNYKIKCINFSKNFLGSARGFFLKKPLAPKDFLKRLFAGAASRSPTEYGVIYDKHISVKFAMSKILF